MSSTSPSPSKLQQLRELSVVVADTGTIGDADDDVVISDLEGSDLVLDYGASDFTCTFADWVAGGGHRTSLIYQ